MGWLTRFFSRSTASREHVASEDVPVGDLSPPKPSRLIVGLGNPGPEYGATRHNVGFRVLEAIAAQHGATFAVDTELNAEVAFLEIAGRSTALLAPKTFMNRSGDSVEKALARWSELDPSDDLLIVYDDLDLPTGRIRLRPSGGAGGHNGMGDILDHLDSKAVPRLRFGVSRPQAGETVIDWVLGGFTEAEEAALPAALEWAVAATEAVVESGVLEAMNRFNAERPSVD